MLLGAQYPEPVSKYPFAESSAQVSPLPFSGMAAWPNDLIPADLFSDVVIDCDDDSFVVEMSGFLTSPPRIEFSWSCGDESGLFTISEAAFAGGDMAMFVLPHAVVRVRSGLGHDLWDLVSEISFDGRIAFDPHCFRVAERRLRSFDVHGISVSGDVVFKSGFNAGVSLYEVGGVPQALSIDLSPGAGEGLQPCGSQVDDEVSSIIPDSDGSIRFESDDCYSIAPVAANILEIFGHCTACCSCEGDYVPVALAVKSLIGRISKAYGALSELNERYNAYVGTGKTDTESIERLKIVLSADKYAHGNGSRISVAIGVSSLFGINVDITRVKLAFITYGSARVIDFIDTPSSISGDGITEIKRFIRSGGTTKYGSDAIVTPEAGHFITLEPGGSAQLMLEFGATSAGSSGSSVMNASSVHVTLFYRTSSPSASYSLMKEFRITSHANMSG